LIIALNLADIITDLYLSEIKAYKPSAQVSKIDAYFSQEKIDLPTSFAAPKAPAQPEIAAAPVAAAADAALSEEEWPALVDTIDDPHLYNGMFLGKYRSSATSGLFFLTLLDFIMVTNAVDEYDISTENDDGSLFPKRLKPIDYDHAGH
jgi:hypothetical protein